MKNVLLWLKMLLLKALFNIIVFKKALDLGHE